MKEQHCIQVGEHSVLEKEVKVDFKEFFKSFAKAIPKFLMGDPASAIDDGIDALFSVRVEDKTAHRAYRLIYDSLRHALFSLFRDSSDVADKYLYQSFPEVDYNALEYEQMVGQVNLEVNEHLFCINQNFFKHPAAIPLLTKVQAAFQNWLEAIHFPAQAAETVAARLPHYFVFALNVYWRERRDYFEPIKAALETPFPEAASWGRLQYENEILKRWTAPMFEETFGLDKVYVPLRAKWQTKVEPKKKNRIMQREEEEGKITYHVQDAETHIMDWLKADKSECAMVLLRGGPGSGKSSLMKKIACNLCGMGRRFYFIELHHFDLENNLETAIQQYVDQTDFLKETVFDKDGYAGMANPVFIFDGLDELTKAGGATKAAASEFMSKLTSLVGGYNERDTWDVRTIVTGRDIIIQEHAAAIQKGGRVLELMSFAGLEKEEELRKYERKYHGALKREQRGEWWKKYQAAKAEEQSGVPVVLQTKDYEELTAQPLLNYLLALSHSDEPETFSSKQNLNSIYYHLVERVRNRPWGRFQHLAENELKEEEFFLLMEEVAVTAWHKGDVRTTTKKAIEERCGQGRVKTLLEKIRPTEEKGTGYLRLLTAFYFRKKAHEGDDQAFEFTHKSFGEYLVARRIFREVRELMVKIQFDDSPGEFDNGAKRWFKLTGLQPLTLNVWAFLQREASLISNGYNWPNAQKRENPFVEGKSEAGRQVHAFLIQLFEHILKSGFESDGLGRHHEVMRQSRNAQETLWLAIAAAADTALPDLMEKARDEEGRYKKTDFSFVNWPEKFGIFEFYSFMQTGGQVPLANKGYRHLYHPREDFSGLRLQGAVLKNSYFHRAVFSGAYLFGAYLFGAYLQGAYLTGANLQGANLQGAYLFGADLQGADLQGAYLTGAYLQGANLQGANLQGADLQGADLQGADLTCADLTGADLTGADLQGAYLTRADLQGAYLQYTNYKSALIPQAFYRGTLYTQFDHLPAILAYLAGEGPEPDLPD